MIATSLKTFLAAGAIALAGTTAGLASTIYDSGVTPAMLDDALQSDADTNGTRNFAAQQITFATDVVIESLTWSGAYGFSGTPTGADAFTFELYSDAGGSPSLTAFNAQSLTLTDRENLGNSGITVFNYSAEIMSLSVAAGTYWISLFNNTDDDADDNWFWPSLNSGGVSASRSGQTEAWVTQSNRTFVLTLEGEVIAPIPLPAGLPALAAALGLLGWMPRRAA